MGWCVLYWDKFFLAIVLFFILIFDSGFFFQNRNESGFRSNILSENLKMSAKFLISLPAGVLER